MSFPPTYCPHGFLITPRLEEGWMCPYAPAECRLCPQGELVRIRFRAPTETESSAGLPAPSESTAKSVS